MKESMYRYINPGVIHFMAYPETMNGEGPILETITEIATDPFYMAIEVSWIKDNATREEVKRILDSSYLQVYYGAQPRLLTSGLNLNSFHEEERKRAIETLKEGVDEAIELGALAMAFLSGKNVEGERREEAVARLVDSIEEVCTYAEKKRDKLDIVLEVFDSEIDKCCLVGPASLAREVAQRVRNNYKSFGLMADLSHLPLLHETPEQSLDPIKEYLVHLHIGNAVLQENHPAYGDSHPRFGLEGGSNDVEELVDFLKYLLQIGYLDGKEAKTISFEVKPLKGELSSVVLANAKRVLKKAWARL